MPQQERAQHDRIPAVGDHCRHDESPIGNPHCTCASSGPIVSKYFERWKENCGNILWAWFNPYSISRTRARNRHASTVFNKNCIYSLDSIHIVNFKLIFWICPIIANQSTLPLERELLNESCSLIAWPNNRQRHANGTVPSQEFYTNRRPTMAPSTMWSFVMPISLSVSERKSLETFRSECSMQTGVKHLNCLEGVQGTKSRSSWRSSKFPINYYLVNSIYIKHI